MDSWNEKAVFLEALSLSPAERGAYLSRACPSPEAQEHIYQLLRHHLVTRGGDNAVPEATRGGELRKGDRVEEFEIVRQIGEGGMGIVYEATDLILGRCAAIKVLRAHLAISKDARERFLREAQLAAALMHPGIVPTYRFGSVGEIYFIASQFIDGQTVADAVSDRIADPPLDPSAQREWWNKCASIVEQVAEALDYAHRSGVIHRDVKPANILIGVDGRAKITDFGIAKALDDPSTTLPTDVFGSCHYMSPERAVLAQTQLDGRSDVFSAGIVLYEMLALKRPFEGSDFRQVLKAIVDQDPVPLRRLLPHLPADWETVCEWAMQKDRERRYRTAAHLAADLRCVRLDIPILAPKIGWLSRTWRRIKRRPGTASALTAAAFAAVAAVAFSMYVHADRRSKGHLVTSEQIRGATIKVQRRPWGSRRAGEIRTLGIAPLDEYLEPGLYRVWVALRSGDTVEASVLCTAGHRDELAVSISTPSLFAKMKKIPGQTYTLGVPAMADSPHTLMNHRTVQLPTFWISATEVSNAEYREYVEATGMPPPAYWSRPYNPAYDRLPVTFVSWDEANAYCRWRGGRMPTHDEWEAAARGTDERRFPWGDKLREDTPEHASVGSLKEYATTARAIDDDAGCASPFGVLHMCSNVQEYLDEIEELPKDNAMALVLAGRSWSQAKDKPAWQIWTLSSRSKPSWDRGFRLVIPAKE